MALSNIKFIIMDLEVLVTCNRLEQSSNDHSNIYIHKHTITLECKLESLEENDSSTTEMYITKNWTCKIKCLLLHKDNSYKKKTPTTYFPFENSSPLCNSVNKFLRNLSSNAVERHSPTISKMSKFYNPFCLQTIITRVKRNETKRA